MPEQGEGEALVMPVLIDAEEGGGGYCRIAAYIYM